MNALLSVVIPCYNRSTLLKQAIDSALAQTARASEVIIVDDGPTDNTRELCVGYGNQIKYVSQENAGPFIARNTAVTLQCRQSLCRREEKAEITRNADYKSPLIE